MGTSEVKFIVNVHYGGVMGIMGPGKTVPAASVTDLASGSQEQPSESAQDDSSAGVGAYSISPDEGRFDIIFNRMGVKLFGGQILPQPPEKYNSNQLEYPFLANMVKCTLEQCCAQDLFFRLIFGIGPSCTKL